MKNQPGSAFFASAGRPSGAKGEPPETDARKRIKRNSVSLKIVDSGSGKDGRFIRKSSDFVQNAQGKKKNIEFT